MTNQLIKINNLSKVFNVNKIHTSILKDIDFTLSKGNIVSISGPSGSGKSTFLNILGLLDSQFQGEYQFLNYNLVIQFYYHLCKY